MGKLVTPPHGAFHTREFRRDIRDDRSRFERLLFVPELYEEPGKPHALVVHQQDDELVDVAEERTTTDGPDAQPLESPSNVGLSLTHDQVRWLRRALDDLVDRWDEEEKEILAHDLCKSCGEERGAHREALRLAGGELDEPTALHCLTGGTMFAG